MHVIRNSGLTAVTFALLFAVGCQQQAAPTPYRGPTLTVQDLGAENAQCPASGYVLLEESSQGRWPGAVAIALIDPAPEELPRIATLTGETGSWWNQLFTTVPEVREVIVMDRLSVVSPDASLDDIVERAHLARAAVILLYGHAPAPACHTALAGVIRDTDSGKTIALVRAQAGPEDFSPHPDTTVEEDQRHIDPNYIVERKFEQQVRRCVLDLIRQDRAVPETQQSPWEQHERRRDERRVPVTIEPDTSLRW